jgi:carboxyl-terminal processing protease
MMVRMIDKWQRIQNLLKRHGGWAILLLATLAGGLLRGPVEEVAPGEEMSEHPLVKSYGLAVRTIDENYVQPPDWELVASDAVRRMLNALDPHSNFYDRRQFTEMQNEQNSRFYGIGATILQRNSRIYIIGITPGMPAERAGIRYGDAIIEVDGESTRSWSQTDVLTKVRGERGTEVEITVERAGEAAPQTFQLERDEVPYPSVRNFFIMRPGIGYIGLTGGFNQETTTELRRAIGELKEQGMGRLLLDLRGNHGGLLRQAIEVAETFLPPKAEIVSIRGREGRVAHRVYRSENPSPETMPVVILVDEETASAAEIVAGALQDHRRAFIVGEESFGKGLVQQVYRLRWGTGLTLTTARYFTPSGRSIQRAYGEGGVYDYVHLRRQNGPLLDSRDRGGINPDLLVRSEEEPIRLRDACFEFARQLSAGQFPDLLSWQVRRVEYGHRWRGNEYQLTLSVLRRFRQYLVEHPQWQVSELQVDEQLEYVERQIRAEMISTAYGVEIAGQFLLDSDVQALRAVEQLEKLPNPPPRSGKD